MKKRENELGLKKFIHPAKLWQQSALAHCNSHGNHTRARFLESFRGNVSTWSTILRIQRLRTIRKLKFRQELSGGLRMKNENEIGEKWFCWWKIIQFHLGEGLEKLKPNLEMKF